MIRRREGTQEEGAGGPFAIMVFLSRHEELIGIGGSLGRITLIAGQHAGSMKRLAKSGRPCTWWREGLLEPSAPLPVVAPDEPEVPERGSETQESPTISSAREPLKGGSQVWVLAFQASEPFRLPGTVQRWRGALGEGEEVRRVCLPVSSPSVLAGQQLPAVLADRLQHQVARLTQGPSTVCMRLWSTSAATPSRTEGEALSIALRL